MPCKVGKGYIALYPCAAQERGLNPKKLSDDEIAWLTEELMMDVNFVNRFFEKHRELMQKIAGIQAELFFLDHGRYPKSWKELMEFSKMS